MVEVTPATVVIQEITTRRNGVRVATVVVATAVVDTVSFLLFAPKNLGGSLLVLPVL